MRTLLVSMPWAAADRPSLALGTLVAVGRERGHDVRAWEAALLLGSMIGHEAYELFAETPSLFGLTEHLFAVDCFGAQAVSSEVWLDRWRRRLPNEVIARVQELRDRTLPDFLDQCESRVQESGADVVGFSCTFNQTLASLALARRLKVRQPELTVLLGGACVHGPMGVELARAFPELVDHVFLGEAEAAFPALLDALAAGSDVRSVAGVAPGGGPGSAPPTQDLDAQPIPDFEHYFEERARLRHGPVPPLKSLPFESSRGCWWGQRSHCTFCGLNNAGMAYRRKSVERVTQEIVTLVRRHGTTQLMAADNILPAEGYRDLLPALADLPIDLDLFYETKANVHRDDVCALAAAGVRWIQPGIESFSDGVLRAMRKGVTGLQNVQLLRWCAELGIEPSYNILCGFEGEEDRDYEEMLALVARIEHLPPPSGRSALAQVHRFSPFHARPEQHGIRGLRPAAYYDGLFPKGVVDLEALAYFFEHDLPEDAPYRRHRERLDAALDRWRAAEVRRSAVLGAGSVEIRTLVSGASRDVSRLEGVDAYLFVALDRVRSIARLAESVEPRLGRDAAARTERIVATLSELGAVARVGDRAVATVPFARPHTETDLRRWEDEWFPISAGRPAPRAAPAAPAPRAAATCRP